MSKLVSEVVARGARDRAGGRALLGFFVAASTLVAAWLAAAPHGPGLRAQQPAVGGNRPVVIAPHRAVYDINLDRAKGASGVADMTGRMVYELTGSTCSGYTQTMRFVTRMANQEGQITLTDLRSSSWEDATADHFRFNSSQYRNEKLTEATDGDAKREGAKAPIKLKLVKPGQKETALKAGTLFPMQHSIELIVAARAGQSSLVADLYDGSDKGEKVYSTTAQIGKLRPPGSNSKLRVVKGTEPLDRIAAWPISISYFEPGSDKQDSVPAYEISFLYFENGVSRQLFIDYGEFAIRGALRSIEFLDPDKCDR